MQLLWSRASDAHVCSSRAYTHVSRSAISRITNRSRQRKHSDTFAAFYTTDLDSATVRDLLHHDGSHPMLDRETQKSRPYWVKRPVAKRSLISRQPVDFRQMRPRPPMGGIEALNSICDTEEALTRYEASERNYRKFLRSLHCIYDPEDRVSNGYVDYLGSRLTAVQLAVDREQRQDDGLEAREPMTTLQFEKYHYMINKMVDHLISESYYVEFPNDPERARRNFESLDSAWTAIRMLRSEGYPKYNHPSVDPQATKQARDQLADKIRTLFEAWGTSRAAKPKFQVAKICYNLLVCPVPPSIHHYNLLLVGFLRKSHFSLGDIVIESFLEDSRLRPTPQTHVCLLAHYRKKKDMHGFYHIIRRMMALDNRGMLLRRRWYEDVAKIPALHQWARQPEVTTSLQANWVIERPSRGQDIYEALVSGLLGFGRVKDAVKVFVGSLHEGMGTSVELFIYLLKQCVHTLDASTTAILSVGLVDNVEVITSLLLRDNCPQRLIEHLLPVLNLGEPPSWPFSEERAEMIWNLTTFGTDPLDSGRQRCIKTAMFIRYTEAYLSRLKTRIRPMNHLSRVSSPVERAVIAIYCVNELQRLQERQAKLSGTALKYQALQKMVAMLEELTWDLGPPERLAKIHRQVLAVLGDHMPRPAGAVSHEEPSRLDAIATVADDWFHYRISKTRGVISDARRLMLYVELRMITGRRLLLSTRRLLRAPATFGWRSLDLSSLETQAENGPKQPGEVGHKEAQTEDGGLWPKAEMRAVFAGVPAVTRVRVG